MDSFELARDAEYEELQAALGASHDRDADDVVCDFCGEGDGPYDDVVTQVVRRTDEGAGRGVDIKNAHALCADDYEYELG